MTTRESVVTPERFSQGFTYEEYIAQIKVNKDRFEQYYNDFKVEPEDSEQLRKLAQHSRGPKKLLVLGEDWCTDVYRGLPTLARLAEAAGIELRVFPRDQNQDIMGEFLKDGQFMSIPTAVFYTEDHEYICHWLERPEVARREMTEIEAQIRAEKPDIADQEFMTIRRARTAEHFPQWQQATVQELVQLLAQRVGL